MHTKVSRPKSYVMGPGIRQASRQQAGRGGSPRVGSLGASEAPEVYITVSRSPRDTRVQFQWSSEMKTKAPLKAEEREHTPHLQMRISCGGSHFTLTTLVCMGTLFHDITVLPKNKVTP